MSTNIRTQPRACAECNHPMLFVAISELVDRICHYCETGTKRPHP